MRETRKCSAGLYVKPFNKIYMNYHLLYFISSVYDLYVIVAFRKFLECVCISLDTFLAYYVSILYKYVSDIKVGL